MPESRGHIPLVRDAAGTDPTTVHGIDAHAARSVIVESAIYHSRYSLLAVRRQADSLEQETTAIAAIEEKGRCA